MADHPFLTISLAYSGALADEQEIDLYDVGHALIGFQRSLALTTHLVFNGEVITQAPSLSGARISAYLPEDGSWTLKAAISIIATGIWLAGTAPRDTPIGNLVSSAYDYVVSETLGFHVDYQKTLGQQIEEHRSRQKSATPPDLPQSKFDSLIEKCQVAIRDMHRPIVKSETAAQANITASIAGHPRPIGRELNRETFEYIAFTVTSELPSELTGRVSSYNINTFKGRIYVLEEYRPIPFELAKEAQSPTNVAMITESLRRNAQDRTTGDIKCVAFRQTSKSGRLKALYVVEVRSA